MEPHLMLETNQYLYYIRVSPLVDTRDNDYFLLTMAQERCSEKHVHTVGMSIFPLPKMVLNILDTLPRLMYKRHHLGVILGQRVAATEQQVHFRVYVGFV
eukprot:TRINITY_DN6713_c0_g2_i7.p5 TRINITY_DN6713_c0_g2~~TRINITY_DN6713_c0_g2_i7.p5  ORF type:complete len:100 (+),score=2.58 TRINITY_DN6713_c0_g2_i7:1096-1395(+)